ncbi:acetylornithine deacetylase [Chelatococcus sp. SYSU_G07232]|uniref:Acetylornithine deacetylase n=1 Tax=Chelatococcus albus TaxID=3047466 RepID=A0ABT7AF63_9HYPH|nr:acetylornithine deacetylase [Chelatococcus sp. SYSU_G07232]MDJ1158009.1 acetylornithine deacetylase [Chelatococcus sp. SYSU_G07232]
MTGPRLTPLDMLARLVAFDTESTKSNLPLIAFVEDYLKAWNVPFVRIPNATGDKAALFATIGPSDRGGVVLSGHTDVVPVAGQAWTSDPFALRVADGRAYGRGAVDMKGFCATALALVPEFLAARLETPIHIFLSYDEETTCLGVVDGIRRMGHDLPRPIAVFVGEPTGLEVTDAHKSVITLTTGVYGHEAHSSKPALGASAVMAAAELVTELGRMAEDYVRRGDASGRFDPPYTTIHVGTINGGTARNILARECHFHWEFRGLPDLDESEIPARFAHFADSVVLPKMRRTAPDARIETRIEVSVPGLAPEPGSTAETLALRLAGRNRTIAVPYATEAGRFQTAGIPTVVCGPGSIDQAHQPDEYITLADLEAGAVFLRRLAASLAA